MLVVVVVVDDVVVVSDLTAPPAARDRDGDPELQPARTTNAETTTPTVMRARFIVTVTSPAGRNVTRC